MHRFSSYIFLIINKLVNKLDFNVVKQIYYFKIQWVSVSKKDGRIVDSKFHKWQIFHLQEKILLL